MNIGDVSLKMTNYTFLIRILTSLLLSFIVVTSSGVTVSEQNFVDQDSLVLHEDISNEIESLKNDMVAMVASLRNGEDTSGAEFASSNGISSSKKLLKFDWHLKLDQDNRYGLNWKVDYAGNEITFMLSINKTASGFQNGADIFALGFSRDGRLESSDFCILWYDLGYRIHLQDARTDSRNVLQLIDTSQSYCKPFKLAEKGFQTRRTKSFNPLKSAIDEEQKDLELEFDGIDEGDVGENEIAEELIEVVFKRPLDNCDSSPSSQPYYTIDNGTTHLLWFTLKGPLLSLDKLNLTELATTKQYKERDNTTSVLFDWGMKRAQLIASKPEVEKVRNRNLNIEIKMDNFGVPAKETTYWCKLFKLPRKFEARRYHITRYEAVIEKGNEHVVHHMELFNCANLDPNQEQELRSLHDQDSGWSGDCNGIDRPKATRSCKRVILAWAMGAHPLEYPKEVGQSIGGHGYSPYVVLEVHYNNVQSKPGLLDSSGLRFYYTSKLRPFDAGILEVGLEYTDKNSIPPHLIMPIAGYCSGECTRAAMSASLSNKLDSRDSEIVGGGIYVFAAQLHTHLAGVATWTEHVREGQLLAELQRDNHYSPHFQEIRLLPKRIFVAPGDDLIHYCLYDTRNRDNITLGGYATSDEMCVTYLHYYPRIDLEVCKSSVDSSALEAYFAYLRREEGQQTSEKLRELNPHELSAKSVSENFQSIRWSTRRSKELVEFYSKAPLSIQCNRSIGDRYPGFWNGVTPTRIRDPTRGWSPKAEEPRGGQELLEYRGIGHRRRHESCNLAREHRSR